MGCFYEKTKKPLLVYVLFDTKSNKLLSFQYVRWHSKLDPGVIDIQNWEIDYVEAIEISKEFYSETDGFRYDSILIETNNSFPFEDEDWEDWCMDLYDEQTANRYSTRIDPYTGEITSHSIWKF